VTMAEDLQQSQAESTQQEAQSGLQDQVVEPVVESQPGTEQKATPKSYSEEEVSALKQAIAQREADSDRRVNQLQQQRAEEQMRQQIADVEGRAQAEDRRAVEDGEITEAQARDRTQKRLTDYRQEIQQRQALAEGEARLAQVNAAVQVRARYELAGLFADEYGVDAKVLLGDKSITTGPQMEIKAARLAADAAKAAQKGSETFDSGQQGSAGPGQAVNDLDGIGKINYALAHPPRRGS